MNFMFEKLLPHRGHALECVSYGEWDDPADVCVECIDCGEVLVSAEDFDDTSHPVKRDDSLEFIGEIIDIFEDFLEKRKITFRNPEIDEAVAEGDDPETLAIIYGTDFGELQSDLESLMLNWRIVEPVHE